MRKSTISMFSLLGTLTVLSHLTSAHTWNEQLAVIGSDGDYTGAMGYPRGYVARTDAGFNGGSDDYLLPPAVSGRTRINGSDLLCHPDQRMQNQTTAWPRLQVAAGSVIAMKQLENGHVTLPGNQLGKPEFAGTVYVFGTTSPSDQETLADVLEWTADGTGGDGRGYLLASNNFDDGRCHQLNAGNISLARQAEVPDPFPGQPASKNELWCETDVVLPTNSSIMQVGSLLTVYWVWDWQTLPNIDPSLPTGKDEYYTTCSDLEIVASVVEGNITNELLQQDPNVQAVSDYLSRTAFSNAPRALATTPSTGGIESGAVVVTTSAMATTSTIVSTSTSMYLSSSTSTSVASSTSISSSTSTTSSTSSSTIATISSGRSISIAGALSTIVIPTGAGVAVTSITSISSSSSASITTTSSSPLSLSSVSSSTSTGNGSTSSMSIFVVPTPIPAISYSLSLSLVPVVTSSSSSASATSSTSIPSIPSNSTFSSTTSSTVVPSTSLASSTLTSSSTSYLNSSGSSSANPTPAATIPMTTTSSPATLVTLTSLITVTAVVELGETLVVTGEHVVYFTAPSAVGAATPSGSVVALLSSAATSAPATSSSAAVYAREVRFRA